MKKRLAVFVSGSGTNFDAILKAIGNGYLDAEVAMVIASKEGIGAISKAKDHNINYAVFESKSFSNSLERDSKILELLKPLKIDLIVLAGYLNLVTPILINNFRNKIINIHPALLPKYGGKGMYGIVPHQMAIQNKDEYAGATVHFVDECFDTGKIICQRKVKVLPNDTPETLQKRVLTEVEHKILPETIKMICENKISPFNTYQI